MGPSQIQICLHTFSPSIEVSDVLLTILPCSICRKCDSRVYFHRKGGNHECHELVALHWLYKGSEETSDLGKYMKSLNLITILPLLWFSHIDSQSLPLCLTNRVSLDKWKDPWRWTSSSAAAFLASSPSSEVPSPSLCVLRSTVPVPLCFGHLPMASSSWDMLIPYSGSPLFTCLFKCSDFWQLSKESTQKQYACVSSPLF